MKNEFNFRSNQVIKEDGKFYPYDELPKRNKYFKTNLARFVAKCLEEVPGENDFKYLQMKLDNYERHIAPTEPGYQAIAAIQEMLDKGISKEAMMDLVRTAWADSMFNVFLTLEAFYIVKPTWGLYIQDTKGNPIKRVMGDELSNNFEDIEFLPRKKKKIVKGKKSITSSKTTKSLKK